MLLFLSVNELKLDGRNVQNQLETSSYYMGGILMRALYNPINIEINLFTIAQVLEVHVCVLVIEGV